MCSAAVGDADGEAGSVDAGGAEADDVASVGAAEVGGGVGGVGPQATMSRAAMIAAAARRDDIDDPRVRVTAPTNGVIGWMQPGSTAATR
jgi:hypothetical protein